MNLKTGWIGWLIKDEDDDNYKKHDEKLIFLGILPVVYYVTVITQTHNQANT